MTDLLTTTSTTDSTDTRTIQQKLESLESQLNSELQERHHVIHTALLALISRTHHFQLGTPGIGKSLTVRRIVKRISGLEGRYFQWLMTRYTTPEEIFGPTSLRALKDEDKFRRNVEGKMPTAYISFIDETMKANSSILNAMLTIINERLFFNDGSSSEVPLSSLFGASNEMPEGDELWAMWDRLHFRHIVPRLQDGGSFIQMLATPMVEHPEPVLTWDEILEAQQMVDQVRLPSDIFDALKTLRDNLTKEGIEPTERRFVESLKIIRADAFMNGREVADIDDMRSLQHVLWTTEKEEKEVARKVLDLANPIDREGFDLVERVEGLESELRQAIKDADNPKGVAKAAVEIYGKLQKSKQRKDELKKRCDETGRSSEALEILNKKFLDVV